MLINPFVDRHKDLIAGVIPCFDRVVIASPLPDTCHAKALAGYLSCHNIRLFDLPRWAEKLRDEMLSNAERIAADAGLDIEFIRSYKMFRKDQRIKDILVERGDHPCLVHIFSAMEACSLFRLWHDKRSHHTFIKPYRSKMPALLFLFHL